MDEKEKELNNEVAQDESNDVVKNEEVANEVDSDVDVKNDAADNGEDSENANSKEVKYEENDNWEFEANAPTLDSELEIGNEYELNIPKSEKDEENLEKAETTNNDQIVINKKSVKIAAAAILSTAIVALIVVLSIIIFTFPNNKELMNPGNVAMKVGNTNVSVGMYNYYYKGVVSNYKQYAQNGYIDLDINSDYSTQYTVDKDGNKISWLDLFKEDTKKQLQYVVAFYEAGVDAGLKLTDKQQASIDEEIKSIETKASESKISVDDYMSKQYGKNFGIETLKKAREQFYIANDYYNQKFIQDTVDEEEFNTYFEENKNKYYSTKFACVEMIYDTKDESGAANSKALAEKYCSEIKDIDSLKAIIPEASGELIDKYVENGYFETPEEAVKALQDSIELTKTGAEIEKNFGKDITNWLMSSDTPVGSTNYYIDEEFGFVYIFLKTGEPVFDDQEVYSVRHILVTPKSEQEAEDQSNAGKKEYTEEEWQAALDSANAILEKYNAGDKTETSFAVLAEANSDDTESTSLGSRGFYGGAIEGTPLGQMVPEFEGWATDDSRKYGDVEIVKSQFGYHIMFFMNDGPVYKINALRDYKIQKYTDFENKFIDECKVKEHKAIKKTQISETPTAQNVSNSKAQ